MGGPDPDPGNTEVGMQQARGLVEQSPTHRHVLLKVLALPRRVSEVLQEFYGPNCLESHASAPPHHQQVFLENPQHF